MGPSLERFFPAPYHLLVHFNNSSGHRLRVQVTDMRTAVSSWAAQENLFHPRREFRDVGAADMAIASLADYLANISDIGRHDWEVASHRLLDDVRGTLLIRGKSQHVASAQVQREPLLGLLVNHEQFNGGILLVEDIRRGLGQRETLHGYFRIRGKENVLFVRMQTQKRPGFILFRGPEENEARAL